MSTTSLRALAVTVAAIIAVLTGIATGLLSGPTKCSVAATATSPAPAATTGGPGAALGGAGQGNGSSAPPPAQATPTMTCTTAAFGATPALTAFLGAVFVGGTMLLLLLLLTGRGRDGGAAGPARHSSPAPPGVRAEADRTALVQAAIYVRDRVTSRALADRLGAALREAGVETLEPTGARFDPAHHEAGGSAPSPDPSKVGSIAAVEVPGYADRGGRVLRAPVVTVYQGSPARDRTRRGEQR